jgi:hypothetical protein
MPNPAQSDLHVNVPLTNVSIAYTQSTDVFIATKVFPSVPVQKQSDLYWKYSKSDFRRTDVERRAPSTESPGTGWNVTTDTYFTHVYAVHKDIDDQLRANADSVFSLDKEATEFVTMQLLLKRDIDWAARYFKTGVWGTDLAGVTGTPSTNEFKRFDDAASDPISLFSELQTNFVQQNAGRKANTLVLGAHVINALKNHPDILDRIKYTQKGIVTEDLLASLLGVDKILVALATQTTTERGLDAKSQDAAATYDFIADSKSALLVHTPASPGLMTPAAGYTFTWSGYLGGNATGTRIKRFRMEPIASDRIEGEATYDMKVTGSDLGLFMHNVVS